MSGNFQDWSETAPGGKAETRAAVAAGLNQAMQATMQTQRESAAFILEHGDQVLNGHSPVNKPGRMGPDPGLGGESG